MFLAHSVPGDVDLLSQGSFSVLTITERAGRKGKQTCDSRVELPDWGCMALLDQHEALLQNPTRV